MHYYLSSWAPVTVAGDRYWEPRIGTAAAVTGSQWWCVDLRPDPRMSAGWSLVACEQRPDTEIGSRYLGDDPAAAIGSTVIRRLGNDLSLTLESSDIARIIVELLTDHARTDGTRWRPLQPRTSGPNAWEVHLGGLLWAVPRMSGGATYDDSFTAPNGLLYTAGTALTWTAVQEDDGWAVVSNEASATGSQSGFVAYARAEHDSASVDVFAQASITALSGDNSQFGPCVRFDPVANTSYMAQRSPNSGGQIIIRKTVNGSRTNLTSSLAVALSLPETLRTEAEGSTIRALLNGVEQQAVTDTSIGGGTRGGLYAHRITAVTVDDFSFGDLATSSTTRQLTSVSPGVSTTTGTLRQVTLLQGDLVGMSITTGELTGSTVVAVTVPARTTLAAVQSRTTLAAVQAPRKLDSVDLTRSLTALED